MSTFSCPLLSEDELRAVSLSYKNDSLDASTLHAILDEYGFCVVTDVLSTEVIQAMEDLLKRDLNSLIDHEAIYRTMSPSAQAVYEHARDGGIAHWPAESLSECYAGKQGFLCKRGLAHSEAAWRCRFRVRKIYEQLHGSTDLVSSFDAIFASNNNGNNAKIAENEAWPHVDRSEYDPMIPNFDEWQVYQSILYLWSSQHENASTTVVWPKSHKLYDATYPPHHPDARSSSHFCKLLDIKDATVRDSMYQAWCQQARRVPVPAGGCILWTSQTTHQGWTAGPRLAVPVCWEPRSRRSETVRRRKMLLAALGLPTTHWASLGRTHAHKAAPEAVAGIDMRDNNPDTVAFPLKGSIDGLFSLKKDGHDDDNGIDSVSVWYMLRVPDMYRNNDDRILPHDDDVVDLEDMLRDELLQVL